jgi:hypothetical protein
MARSEGRAGPVLTEWRRDDENDGLTNDQERSDLSTIVESLGHLTARRPGVVEYIRRDDAPGREREPSSRLFV